MPRQNRRDPVFWYRRDEEDVIAPAVRWYISYQLSLRVLVELLADPCELHEWLSRTSEMPVNGSGAYYA